ncbi:hypothetical protein MES5069_130125 [Mesorhizobium escarrei]|uniref:Uncharacterized protein n=1 Tax=Mesorhizobium escarrei TaxID=666018 RepID=A0ABN8JEY6_9HYPH|nr:hypothetical protein MES5069_130125 [Mesorhizobium escarrei]
MGLAFASGGHGADFLSKVGDGGANELVGGRVFLPKDEFKFIQIDSEYFSNRKSRLQTLFRVSDSNTL